MRLLLETRRLSTPVEVIDWFYNLGYVVYDVQKATSRDGAAPKSYVYTLETSQKNGALILRQLPPRMKKEKSFKIRPDPFVFGALPSKPKPGKRPT